MSLFSDVLSVSSTALRTGLLNKKIKSKGI